MSIKMTLCHTFANVFEPELVISTSSSMSVNGLVNPTISRAMVDLLWSVPKLFMGLSEPIGTTGDSRLDIYFINYVLGKIKFYVKERQYYSG